MNDNDLLKKRQDAENLAERLIVDSIWKNANIETNVTYPQTEQIFENLETQGLKPSQIMTVVNLKHAWMWLTANADRYVDWELVSAYNRLVGATLVDNPGYLRTTDVRIGGTKWKPEVPSLFSAQNAINQVLLNESDPVRRALRLFLTICRGQFFNDGNKRTATMIANHSLIHDGVGIFALDPSFKQCFGGLLTNFYETNDESRILTFLTLNAVEHLPGGLTLAETQKCQRKQMHR